MVNKDLISAKLSELARRVQRVRSHVPSTASELADDPDALDIVAFNLMLAVQVCSDIASHLIADEGWPAAQTLGEGFARLQEHRVIDTEIAKQLKEAVGLRNVVAHGYAGIDVELCHRAATQGLADLESFAQQVGTWLVRQ